MTERGGRTMHRMIGLAARASVSVCLLGAGAAWPAQIYSCIDANGKKLTSDRPIPECATRDQRVLNPDGSVRKIVPPTPTADERAEQEARERQVIAERVAQQDAVRRDRNLMLRFPSEAAHNKARAAALDDTKAALQRSERRLVDLAAERKPLLDEAEFYSGKSMPPKLKQQLESNDTAVEAQRVLIQNQQAEIGRVNAIFDVELTRLRKLWAGAPPGSLGAMPTTPAAPAGSSPAGRKTAVK